MPNIIVLCFLCIQIARQKILQSILRNSTVKSVLSDEDMRSVKKKIIWLIITIVLTADNIIFYIHMYIVINNPGVHSRGGGGLRHP